MKPCSFDPYFHIGFLPMPETVRLSVAGAPDFLCGLRALFVSDFHLRACVREKTLDRLMETILHADADIAFLGGDYGESAEQTKRLFGRLRKGAWRLGCYAVAGNNDRENFPDIEALKKAATDAGIDLLCNETQSLPLGGSVLRIGGCDEYKRGEPETEALFGENEDGYRILLSHYPTLPACRVDLMLSGHTHGGQFNLFGITPYHVGFERRFHISAVNGLGKYGSMRLLVSHGIGVSRLPLRIGARPQIHILEFVKEKS